MHHHQTLEMVGMSLNLGMDVQTVVYPFNRPQLSNKKEPIYGAIWMNLKCIMRVKVARHESTICMVPFTWHSGKHSLQGQRTDGWCPVAGDETVLDYKDAAGNVFRGMIMTVVT